MINKIIKGDCLNSLKELEENSVDSIVTDPPYELGFMGKSWDSTGIANNVELWKECLRVLKPGGHLLAFSGTRTYHRMASAIEDAGFEVRDMIEWVYGSGFPKSLNIGKAVDKLQGNEREVVAEKETKDFSQWEGLGTALKPAHEPICMARKPLSEKTVAENCLKWGTGGIDIDGSRVEGKLEGDPNRFAKTDGGSFNKFSYSEPVVRSDGRFPANLIHDGSDEVKECFPNESERFFKSIIYQPKASKSERGQDNNHPTVKPIALMEYLIKMVTPKGGIVLDPFAGSGTTLVACKENGFKYIGIEKEEEYIKIIEARLAESR